MGFRINTNVVSVNAQRSLGLSKRALDKSLEKLGSGQRINRASDDAAGLAASEEFKAQIKGLKQARRNSQDGISLIQIAEGALSQVANILIRLRELAIQSASDTIGPEERSFLNSEFTQLMEEIERIVASTNFNGVQLLDGSETILDIQIGTGNDSFVDRVAFNPGKIAVDTSAMGLQRTSVLGKLLAQGSLGILDRAISLVSKIRADLGGTHNRLQSIIANHDESIENLSAANSRVRDTDIARETAEMTRGNILVRAGTSVLMQANQTANSALNLLSSAVQT